MSSKKSEDILQPLHPFLHLTDCSEKRLACTLSDDKALSVHFVLVTKAESDKVYCLSASRVDGPAK